MELTYPFKYLTPDEIDKYFIYCDTDSLLFQNEVRNKCHPNYFHDFSSWKMGLGKWRISKKYMY